MASFPGVAQLVARVVWDHQAAGSNPVTRTTSSRTAYRSRRRFLRRLSFIPSLLLSQPNPLTLGFGWGAGERCASVISFATSFFKLIAHAFCCSCVLAKSVPVRLPLVAFSSLPCSSSPTQNHCVGFWAGPWRDRNGAAGGLFCVLLLLLWLCQPFASVASQPQERTGKRYSSAMLGSNSRKHLWEHNAGTATFWRKVGCRSSSWGRTTARNGTNVPGFTKGQGPLGRSFPYFWRDRNGALGENLNLWLR